MAFNWAFLVKEPAAVGESGGGIAPSLVGTAILVTISSLVGVPFGIGVGIYLSELAGDTRFANFTRMAINTFIGVPSIVGKAMSLGDHFPATVGTLRIPTGRTARRVYIAMVLLLLLLTTALRVYAFVLTRRIHAVMSGLSELVIDKTTEEEAVRTVPYLIRSEGELHTSWSVERGDVDLGIERNYYVSISNQSNWMHFVNFATRVSDIYDTRDSGPTSWVFAAADLLGYRYVGYGAQIVVLNGKVSAIRYRIGTVLEFPQLGMLSVRSAHAYWTPYQRGSVISSIDDENLRFRVTGSDQRLNVWFSPDASPALRAHLFQVDLRCFWMLAGCRKASQIGSLLWRDKNEIESATTARLRSNDPCPDRVLSERARYLADINVVLLKSTGFRNESVNEDGLRVDEIWTDYNLVEVLRGRSSIAWNSVRSKTSWSAAGTTVIAFANHTFESCRMILATPSALSAVRNSRPAPRRFEDELPGSAM